MSQCVPYIGYPRVLNALACICLLYTSGTDAEPGTVFRFEPDAMARHSGATASLHDLKLVDLFDAATLLGYEAEGLCLGMQVENPSPAVVTVGLTPKVAAALPLLVETVAGELARLGSPLVPRAGAAG